MNGDADDIYVLVLERDVDDKNDPRGRPIVFEQYIDQGAASLESIKRFQARLGSKYGQTRIAKLEFIDEQGANNEYASN